MGGFGHIDFIVPHFFGVAVVGGNKHSVTVLQGILGYQARALVHHFYGLDHGFKLARMTHHIAVSKVNNNKVILARSDLFEGFVLNDIGFHFRMFGKGGRVKTALDFNAVLSGIRFNLFAVKEGCNVFEFLRFSQAQLL